MIGVAESHENNQNDEDYRPGGRRGPAAPPTLPYTVAKVSELVISGRLEGEREKPRGVELTLGFLVDAERPGRYFGTRS
jgi:hypothetical protein